MRCRNPPCLSFLSWWRVTETCRAVTARSLNHPEAKRFCIWFGLVPEGTLLLRSSCRLEMDGSTQIDILAYTYRSVSELGRATEWPATRMIRSLSVANWIAWCYLVRGYLSRLTEVSHTHMRVSQVTLAFVTGGRRCLETLVDAWWRGSSARRWGTPRTWQ